MAFWFWSGIINPDEQDAFHWTDAKVPNGAVSWQDNEALMEEFGIMPGEEVVL